MDTKSATNSSKDQSGLGGAITLHDVAARASVHPVTVSHALNGTGRVAAKTREAVQQIAEELATGPIW